MARSADVQALVLRHDVGSPPASNLHAARIALARRAVAENPGSNQARNMLVDSLLQADRPDLAAALFDSEVTSSRHELRSLTVLARTQYANRDFLAALRTLEAARRCPGFGREQQLLRFESLVAQGDVAAAEGMLADVWSCDPTNASALKLLARGAFRRGDPQSVLEQCERVLSREAGHTAALHYRLVSLALLHRDAEAAAALSMDRLVTVTQLAIPSGWYDLAAFHEQLIAEVRNDASLRPDPRGLATSQGQQTQGRSQADGPAMLSLVAALGAAVEAYAAALSPHATHPFIRSRPSRGRMIFWSVLYSGAGYQKPHFHPGGWLSGVYHASGDGQGADGSLVLGDCIHLQRRAQQPPWGQRVLASRAGQLVLFPSFVPHATTVPAAGTERVSVAFDVMHDQ